MKSAPLSLEPADLVLESSSRVGSGPLDLVLHRLEVAEQVGEVRALLAKRGVLVDEAGFDALFR